MSDDFVIGSPEKEKQRPALTPNMPPPPTPSSDFQVGTPEQQKAWYDGTVTYRKYANQAAAILVAQGVGAGIAAPAIRTAFMALMGGGIDAWSQNLSRILGAKDVPQASLEAAKEIGSAGALQGLAEVGGIAVGGVAYVIGKTAAKAKELIDFARQWKMPVSGPEATGGATGKLVQVLGQSMIGGRGFAEAMKAKFFAGLNIGVEETLQLFGQRMTQLEVGGAIKTGFKIARDNFRKMSSSLYEGFLTRVKGLVGSDPIVNFTKEGFEEGKKALEEVGDLWTKYPQTKPPAEVQKFFDMFVPEAGSGVRLQNMRMAPGQRPPLTLTEAQNFRTWIRDMKGSDNPETQRLAFRFEKVVDDAMKSALDKIPTEGGATLKTELDEIDKAYHEGKSLFEGKAFKALVDKYPEHMAHDIGLTDVTAMGDVKKALVKYGQDPEKWNLFRRMWLQDKIGAAEMTDSEPGQRLAKGVVDLADSFKSKAKPMADEFFSDPTGRRVMANIDKFAELTRSKVGLTMRSDSHLFVNYSILHSLLLAGLWTARRGTAMATAMVPAGLTRLMFNDAVTDGVVAIMKAAGKAGTVLTPPQMAQIARLVRLANQGYDDLTKDKK
jgi:hypothetical protein